jgi:hypothetical protein
MKRIFLVISLFVLLSTSSAWSEEDYKRLYLEQKVQSLRLEMQNIQLRFIQLQSELPEALAELQNYMQLKDDNSTDAVDVMKKKE